MECLDKGYYGPGSGSKVINVCLLCGANATTTHISRRDCLKKTALPDDDNQKISTDLFETGRLVSGGFGVGTGKNR